MSNTKFSLSALFLLCIITTAIGQLTSDGCYREYKDYKVTCMTSFMSQAVGSLEECGALCTRNAPKCKAAQMSPFPESSCQLFDKAVPVPASAGRRKRIAGCYGYGPTLISGQGYCYLLPNGYGCSAQPVTTVAPQTPPTPPTPPTVPTDPPTVPTVPTDPPTTTTQAVITFTDAPTTQPSVTPTISDPQLPPEATCPAGKVARYTYVEGYKLSAQPDFTFQSATEQDCMTACTNNRSPDGKQAPCRSADYNAKTKECAVSVQITPPLGTTTASADADTKHFEKVCVSETIGQNCPGAYFRSPQHILVGFAQAVTTATSTVDCLEQCASSQTRFNFACSSGMFYFDEASNNCILNAETRTNNPTLFVPENTDGVEYFEPGCIATRRSPRQAGPPKKRNRNILKLNSDTFTAWTMCDTVARNHMRFRQCTTLNPNRCQVDSNGCDPAKENEYDLEVNVTNPIGKVQQSKKSPAHKNPKFGSPTAAKATTPPAIPGTTPKATTVMTTAPKTVPTTTRKPEGGECVPVIGRNGRPDCDNGTRLLPNGRKQACVPSKNCDKGRGKGPPKA